MEKYKLYSRGTAGGGAFVKSSEVQSSSTGAGGSVVKSSTTSSGGASTSSAGGNHRHLVFNYKGNGTSAPNRLYEAYGATGVVLQSSVGGDLYTAGASGDHTHETPNHSHGFSFELDDHVHEVTTKIPEIRIDEHRHDMEHGIFTLDRLPTAVEIKVDGNVLPNTELSGENVDLIPYLSKDSNGKIIRDRWATIEIAPNDLGRINATVISRAFLQSHEGGVY